MCQPAAGGVCRQQAARVEGGAGRGSGVLPVKPVKEESVLYAGEVSQRVRNVQPVNQKKSEPRRLQVGNRPVHN